MFTLSRSFFMQQITSILITRSVKEDLEAFTVVEPVKAFRHAIIIIIIF